MTNLELKEFVASLAGQQAETGRQIRESQAKTDRQIAETDRQIKELGKQLGGLGQKFGGFTEGMAFPSMQKILRKRFGMDVVSVRNIARNGRSLEIDVLAYANGEVNEVYAVEVKSHLREDGLQQMLGILQSSTRSRSEKVPASSPRSTLRRPSGAGLEPGIYLANIHDDTFQIRCPRLSSPAPSDARFSPFRQGVCFLILLRGGIADSRALSPLHGLEGNA